MTDPMHPDPCGQIDITVCIPVYNSAGEIARSVQSIVTQTTTAQVEILLCDDGSTDETRAIIAGLQRQHPNIRLLVNDRNRGRPFSRNRLVAEARGRYLTWLDADDEKYPEMMDRQFQMLERLVAENGPEAVDGVLVFTNFHWLWPGEDAPKLMTPPEGDHHMEELLNARFGGYLWLMMGTTETFRTVGPFDTALPRLQDLDFFVRFVQKCGRFRRIESDAPQCIYYKDDRARGAMQVWQSWCHIWRKHRQIFNAYGPENALRWRRHHYRVARRFAKANRDWLTYWFIAAQEVFFIARARARTGFGV